MVWNDVFETGEPRLAGNMVTIPMKIEYQWKVKKTGVVENGEFIKDVTITVKSRDTVDAWIGKAERRILRAFFRKFSGKQIPDDDTAEEFTEKRDVPSMADTQAKRGPKKKEPSVSDAEFKAADPAPLGTVLTGLAAKAAPPVQEKPPEVSEPETATDAPPEPPIPEDEGGEQQALIPPIPQPAGNQPLPQPAPVAKRRPKVNF
jgi:hypothetical protein